MPLSMAKSGESKSIIKVNGNSETKKFIESLGFVKGTLITVIQEIRGNLIIQVKESKIAVSKELANKIIV